MLYNLLSSRCYSKSLRLKLRKVRSRLYIDANWRKLHFSRHGMPMPIGVIRTFNRSSIFDGIVSVVDWVYM